MKLKIVIDEIILDPLKFCADLEKRGTRRIPLKLTGYVEKVTEGYKVDRTLPRPCGECKPELPGGVCPYCGYENQ